jgi:hypothetical protein
MQGKTTRLQRPAHGSGFYEKASGLDETLEIAETYEAKPLDGAGEGLAIELFRRSNSAIPNAAGHAASVLQGRDECKEARL